MKMHKEKSINDAVKDLPVELAESIKAAWEATRNYDVYDGDLVTYIKVIAQTLDNLNGQIEIRDGILREIKEKTVLF